MQEISMVRGKEIRPWNVFAIRTGRIAGNMRRVDAKGNLRRGSMGPVGEPHFQGNAKPLSSSRGLMINQIKKITLIDII
jgi:hypothetical protein